jgi:hypothetical protein
MATRVTVLGSLMRNQLGIKGVHRFWQSMLSPFGIAVRAARGLCEAAAGIAR